MADTWRVVYRDADGDLMEGAADAADVADALIALEEAFPGSRAVGVTNLTEAEKSFKQYYKSLSPEKKALLKKHDKDNGGKGEKSTKPGGKGARSEADEWHVRFADADGDLMECVAVAYSGEHVLELLEDSYPGSTLLEMEVDIRDISLDGIERDNDGKPTRQSAYKAFENDKAKRAVGYASGKQVNDSKPYTEGATWAFTIMSEDGYVLEGDAESEDVTDLLEALYDQFPGAELLEAVDLTEDEILDEETAVVPVGDTSSDYSTFDDNRDDSGTAYRSRLKGKESTAVKAGNGLILNVRDLPGERKNQANKFFYR
jgi:hypothetical protein